MQDSPNDQEVDDLILEALPDDVVASMEARDRWIATLPLEPGGFEFIVGDLQSWAPGETVRVAFLGGSPDLYEKIEEATQSITAVANVALSFRDGSGYRTWTESDTEYAAEIRVSFDQKGYFSLLGTDSASATIGQPTSAVGGHPHQRSLNLGGFDQRLPAGWKGTSRHEFLHALAFRHEHQNMRGPCEMAFRWDDDAGYQPTKDARGVFIEDAEGRRPGIYTFLSGHGNYWPRAKVTHNLRTNFADPTVTAGPFDAASVMLYRFPPLFYQSHPSPCAPKGDGQELSEGDIRALKLLYPSALPAAEAVHQRRQDLVGAIESSAEGGFESAVSEYTLDAMQRLR